MNGPSKKHSVLTRKSGVLFLSCITHPSRGFYSSSSCVEFSCTSCSRRSSAALGLWFPFPFVPQVIRPLYKQLFPGPSRENSATIACCETGVVTESTGGLAPARPDSSGAAPSARCTRLWGVACLVCASFAQLEQKTNPSYAKAPL